MSNALPMNFAATFQPERLYLAKMLMFLSKTSTKVPDQKISEETDIPMGTTSGKVNPTISYLKGMGIIEPYDNWYKLTTFGEVVLKYDVTFSQLPTQIACHVNMCDSKNGAILYNSIFTSIKVEQKKSRVDIENKYAAGNGKAVTPLINMYTTKEGFEKCRMLSVVKGAIVLHSASTDRELLPVYGALIAHLYNSYFPDLGQVSIDNFEKETKLSKILGWESGELEKMLQQLSGRGDINIVAHLNPLAFSLVKDETELWSKIYNEQV